MIENWKEYLDQRGHYDALLTDLLKVFDCIMHDLSSIAKFQTHGFENDSLNFICSYLLGRNQNQLIFYHMVYLWDLYWGLYVGSILFSIKTLDMLFLQKDVNVAAYTDDNSRYFCEKNPEVLLSKLQVCALKLLEWFSNICVKINCD